MIISEEIIRKVTINLDSTDLQNLCMRTFQFIEERRWKEAKQNVETLLNHYPYNNDLHAFNFLIENEISDIEQIKNLDEIGYQKITQSVYYSRLLKYSPTSLSEAILQGINLLKNKLELLKQEQEQEERRRKEQKEQKEQEKRQIDKLENKIAIIIFFIFIISLIMGIIFPKVKIFEIIICFVVMIGFLVKIVLISLTHKRK